MTKREAMLIAYSLAADLLSDSTHVAYGETESDEDGDKIAAAIEKIARSLQARADKAKRRNTT
jgi:hypothetical protein